MVIHNLSNGDTVYGPIIHTYVNFGKVNESADAMRTYLIKHPLYLKFWRHAQRNRIGISEQGGFGGVNDDCIRKWSKWEWCESTRCHLITLTLTHTRKRIGGTALATNFK